jgi:hypothetical protein
MLRSVNIQICNENLAKAMHYLVHLHAQLQATSQDSTLQHLSKLCARGKNQLQMFSPDST